MIPLPLTDPRDRTVTRFEPSSSAAHGAAAGDSAGFARDFVQALSVAPHRISPKYFYDAAGSLLFDRICELPEYYPTRTELGILRACVQDIASLMEPGAELVEFGAGSLQKVGLLLGAMPAPARFVPIDISGEHLLGSVRALQRTLATEAAPQATPLRITPVTADYTSGLSRVLDGLPAIGTRYGFFPGSTIGNLNPEEALEFLRDAAQLLQGGALILGTDLIKDPRVLHDAYNDAQGVTASFNRNLLVRANRELHADFALDAYAHSAFYNAPESRIEMHLMALRQQTVRLCGRLFTLHEGETLHTENSYKFTVEGVRDLATRAGFTPGPVWTDPDRYFALHWLQAPCAGRMHRPAGSNAQRLHPV